MFQCLIFVFEVCLIWDSSKFIFHFLPICILISHFMDLRVACPFPERLPEEPENDSTARPHCNQRHIRHYWRYIPALEDPRRYELRETISPHVLVDGDGYKDGASHGLVRINGICRRDRRECCNLDTRARVSDYHNNLFLALACIPLRVFVSR